MTIRTKRFLVAIMLFLGTLYGRAQSQADRSMLAEHVFSWMLQNEIDSLCDCMEESVRTMDEETILDAITAVGLARTYFNKVFLPGHSLRAMTAPHYFVPQHQVNMARTLATPMLSPIR